VNKDMENNNENTCKPFTNSFMNKEDGIILIECNMTSPHG
jgi:hypothetical protein